VYSHDYSFNPGQDLSPNMLSWNERPDIHPDDREMLLTKLLIGNEIWMNRKESPSKRIECRSLIVPPINPITGLRYDTVTGMSRGSRVWIVYENGRAYPEYLVRYYRGSKRVTFAVESSDYQLDASDIKFSSQNQKGLQMENSKQDILSFNNINSQELGSQHKEPTMDYQFSVTKQLSGLDHEMPSHLDQNREMESVVNRFIWEYQDGIKWKSYASDHQKILENAFQDLSDSTNSRSDKVRISVGRWTYAIDLVSYTQENLTHHDHRKRKVRRIRSKLNDGQDRAIFFS
jgi:hypothetical protein